MCFLAGLAKTEKIDKFFSHFGDCGHEQALSKDYKYDD
jgi:hypothetical protein